MSSIDQNKIAKNTAMLYVRMAVQTLVSLYTSRVILDALGEVDMGIYNAVGGIVMMFSFLNSTMSTSCQRFFADEMGKGNYAELKRTFSLCVVVFFFIAILIVILSETVGLWFLYNKAKTAGRMDAAKWVFQLSIISFIFTIIKSPYHGFIIIKEKMKVFTYLSFFEVLGNLVIALIISHNSGDRLILYSFLMLVVNIAVSSFYILYCNKFYDECRFKFWWDKQRFMELFGFAGWNMIGSLSVICKSQGLNMLLNMFFGPVINAARTMAYKVYSTVQLFSEYFFTAVKPQILKSYSIGDKQGMLKLVMQSSKFSFFLLFIEHMAEKGSGLYLSVHPTGYDKRAYRFACQSIGNFNASIWQDPELSHCMRYVYPFHSSCIVHRIEIHALPTGKCFLYFNHNKCHCHIR